MKRFLDIIRRLWLGILLILLCAGTLLHLDKKKSRTSLRKTEVAILIISSRPVMEDFLRACRATLARRGYVEGKTLKLDVYNPQGDLSTANTMADDIIQRKPDLVITASTPMLQVMANRNRNGRVRHVFGLVTDPFSAVDSLDRDNPSNHPAHLGGYGTFQPVESIFDMMLELRPDLQKVGTIRNAGEACSEATFLKAKEYCKTKNIELKDITVENSAEVLEATRAVIASNVEALWIGGDNTVEAAIELVTAEANKAGIPVFTHSPIHLKSGTAISLGADYYVVGEITAELAADILDGKKKLEDHVIENKVPELLAMNTKMLHNFTTRPEALKRLQKKAEVIIDPKGNVVDRTKKEEIIPAKSLPKIHMITYNYSISSENAQNGFLEGLKEAGLKKGQDFKLKQVNAAGDMPNLALLVDAAVSDQADLIATFSTPALQTAMKRVSEIPIVYSFVASGVIAGAGKSDTDHRKNITGVDVRSPIEGLLRLIRKNFPQIQKIGFVYTAGVTSSEFYVNLMKQGAKENKFELVTRACSSSMEVSETMRAVLSENVDAVVQIADNNVLAAFETIIVLCDKHKVPLFCNASAFVEKGACLALATDYYDCGRQSAKLAVEVLNGKNPGKIPFEKPKDTVLFINKKICKKLNLDIPKTLLKKADKVFE